MLKRSLYIFLLSLLSVVLSLQAQDDMWKSYLKREKNTKFVEVDAKVFALADGSLYSFNKNSLRERAELWDKTNILSDVIIQDFAYNKREKTFLIYYQNGGIDLVNDDGTFYLDDLKEAGALPKKNLSSLVMWQSKCWLAGDFGVVLLDLKKHFVETSFFLNKSVESFALDTKKKKIYLLHNHQVFYGFLSENLQDPGTWHHLANEEANSSTQPKLSLVRLFYFQGRLLALGTDKTFYTLNPNDQWDRLNLPFALEDLNCEEGRLFLYSKDQTLYELKDLNGLKTQVIARSRVKTLFPSKNENYLYALDNQGKAYRMKRLDANQPWQRDSLEIACNSPYANEYFSMRCKNGYLYTVNGGRDINNLGNKGVVQLFDGVEWVYINERFQMIDPVDILPHYSGLRGRCFVAVWGAGLYEFNGSELIRHYDPRNSKLISAVGPSRIDYVRVGSLCYDKENTLWMAQGGGRVVSFAKDGRWQKYEYDVNMGTNSFANQIALNNGVKWLADYHRGNNSEGVTLYNDKGTARLEDDDVVHISSFVDSQGKEFALGKITSMVLDRKSVLWLGSSLGLCSVVQPQRIPKHGALPVISRPIAGEEPDYYYVLDRTAVLSIAVDNLNRKWLGTQNDGLYLVSEDGTEVLKHYTAEDSPLNDNRVVSLAFDDISGKLYIGTNQGLNSLDTNTGLDPTKKSLSAYLYPNPLRPNDSNIVSLERLPAQSRIQISDGYGHVLFSKDLDRTSFQWNAVQRSGQRLSAGVYTIYIYDKKKNKTQTLRLVVIDSDKKH